MSPGKKGSRRIVSWNTRNELEMRTRLLLLFILFFNLPARAQVTALKSRELKGYIKDLQSVSFLDNPDSVTTASLIHNRINFRWNATEKLYARIEIRNRIYYGEQVERTPGFGKYIDTDEGYFKLGKLWVDRKSVVAHSELDRAMIGFADEKFSIVAGRQRINWGINSLWNPNDLFNAYNFLDFDYEERPGTDGLRFQYFLTPSSSLEAAYKPSKKTDQSVAALLFKMNKWKYDFQFLGGVYNSDLVAGAGWAGNLKDAGFKGEISFFTPKNAILKKRASWTAASSMDYSFQNNLYSTIGLLYQSEPLVSGPGNAPFLNSELSAKNLMPYKFSFFASIVKQFTPLLTGNFTAIYSPTQNSTILFPSISYNLSQSFDLDLAIQSFFREVSGTYRTISNSAFLRMRYSF